MLSQTQSQFPNGNDVEGAALALAALHFTQPDLPEEDEDEYMRLVDEIYEEYCLLFRVPREALTPAEDKARDAILAAIPPRAGELEEKLRSSEEPLLRALAGRQGMAAE